MYTKKIRYKYLLVIFLLVSAPQELFAKTVADWTILTFIQADNNLAPFALRNMHAMQNITENESLNVLIHWNKPNYTHATRYEITAKKIIEHDSFKPSKNHTNLQDNICSSMDWALQHYPAKHYMLILWNHGTGILDRNPLVKDFYAPLHLPATLPWLEIPGLDSNYNDRGILYSDSTKTYLNNQQLAETLHYITTKLGKKIDIIGMDACLMAMLEVGYQIKDYAHYMVASQNSEPGFGWNYEGFLEPLSKKSLTHDPKSVSKLIVTAYKKLYENKISWYTQSAVDLSHMETLKTLFNDICILLLECNESNHPKTRQLLIQTQERALKFDNKAFVDLNSLCMSMLQAINDLLSPKNTNKSYKNSFKKQLKTLHTKLQHMTNEITNAVFANETATVFKAAQGISVYFPTGSIHHSYPTTLFSQNTSWTTVLNQVLNLHIRPQNNKVHANHGAH